MDIIYRDLYWGPALSGNCHIGLCRVEGPIVLFGTLESKYVTIGIEQFNVLAVKLPIKILKNSGFNGTNLLCGGAGGVQAFVPKD